MSLPKYSWEDFNNPKLSLLKEKFNLEEIISKEKDEFRQQIMLKRWVYKVLPRGNPSKDYSKLSSLEILKDAKKGKKFYCSQYALVFLQCSLALGWYSRKLGIDKDHEKGEEEKHHGVCDIWSNLFNKWYLVDPMHNLHYEKNGKPLNSLEIRLEYLKDGAREVYGVIGTRDRSISYKKNNTGLDTPSNYFWFFISLRNNFFEKPGVYDTRTLLWIDEYNKDKIWYKGGGKKGKPHPHPMYESQFIKTNDFSLCFPKMKVKR